MDQLPIYKIKGKFYFLDKRLNEYRNVNNINDRINFDDVSLDDLENPTGNLTIIKAFYNAMIKVSKDKTLRG